jgi:DMSO/TMAO reductase YedYZ molybdopterin-dependent catalytic subunit
LTDNFVSEGRHVKNANLPPGQQLAAADKWPTVGERTPLPGNGPWTVAVEGCVERPRIWSLSELWAMPQVEQIEDIHCVTRWSKLQIPFRGVPLAALLEEARTAAEAKFVSFVAHSPRAHSTSLPLADALALNALIALEACGQPLPQLRGGPVRVIVPGRYFYKSLKWLSRIELLREDRLGFWEETAGYHNVADPWREQRYMAPGLSKQEAARLIAARDFSGRDLRSIDASQRDLQGLNARGALLRDANFRGCNLQQACFDNANLSNAHLQQADLRGASFVGADVEGANFTGADLRGADFRGASMLGVSFCEEAAAAILDGNTRIDEKSVDELTPLQAAFVRQSLSGG